MGCGFSDKYLSISDLSEADAPKTSSFEQPKRKAMALCLGGLGAADGPAPCTLGESIRACLEEGGSPASRWATALANVNLLSTSS